MSILRIVGRSAFNYKTMILNLDPEFSPLGKGIEAKQFNFPSGCEPHIKLQFTDELHCFLTCRIRTTNDIMMLLLATDALKRAKVERVDLFIPFLPFARQDRVMISGEPLSIKVLSDVINLQGYNSVKIYDCHSEVGLALINKSEPITNHDFVRSVLPTEEGFLIVSPDAGAYKKIFKLCQDISYRDKIVLCNKNRDVSTGNITGVVCDTGDFEKKDLYIIDDICDGGGTFILLAEELRKRNCGKVNLIVSHMLHQTPSENLINSIDNIYCTNSRFDCYYEKLSEYLMISKKIKVWNIRF